MKAYVFIGPSLPLAEAQNYCEAEFLPPVELGQISRLLQYKPHVIGIIDGYFDSVPAVWHKEILMALSQGVHVVGGASMGALRAAELLAFGMQGEGEIFEWYRDGIIEADDEVAVLHTTAEHEYRAFSEPMVNIRKTLAQAAADSILDRSTHDTLIEIARQTFYKKRSYRQLLADGRNAGIAPKTITALEAYLKDHSIDLKKLDAIHVLQRVEAIRHIPEPHTATFELAPTSLVLDLLNQNQTVEETGDIKIDVKDLTNHARIEWDDFTDFRLRALTNLFLLQYAAQNGITLTPNEISAGKDDFLAHLGIGKEEIESWAIRNHIPLNQFEQYMQDWLLLRKIKSMASLVDNRTLLWQARLENRFEHLLIQTKEEIAASQHTDIQWGDEPLTWNHLFEYFKEKKQLSATTNALDFAYQFGFTTRQTFILSLLRSYLAQHPPQN